MSPSWDANDRPRCASLIGQGAWPSDVKPAPRVFIPWVGCSTAISPLEVLANSIP